MTPKMSRRSVMVGVATLAAAPIPTLILAAEPVVHEVDIKSFKFDPEIVQVRIGDTIRWTNRDVAPHTATADEFGWDTGKLASGEAAEITVTENMELSYFCVFHPHMKASLSIII